MSSFNRVILCGNLTKDPDLRYTAGKKAVVDTALAVNERYKAGEQWVENTTFVDLTLWGRTAEVANEYLSKGSQILIEGKLRYESWEEKDSGKKRSKIKVVVDQLTMLGKPKSGSERPVTAQEEPAPAGASNGSQVF